MNAKKDLLFLLVLLFLKDLFRHPFHTKKTSFLFLSFLFELTNESDTRDDFFFCLRGGGGEPGSSIGSQKGVESRKLGQ